MAPAHVVPGRPDPATLGRWEELTPALRELHAIHGRPTYEALSARCGLPKSAISYLIGKNAVPRPSKPAVLRLVEGCLRYRAYADDAIAAEVSAWDAALDRLAGGADARPTEDHAVAPEAPPASPALRTTRPRLVVAACVLVALVALVATVGYASAHRPTSAPVAAPTAPASAAAESASPSSAAAASAPAPNCVVRRERQVDTRLDLDWSTVFYCVNQPADVYAWADHRAKPIAKLESTTSWFVCWTRGARIGDSDVWYYTQGDTLESRPDLDAWGFVSASSLLGSQHPRPGVTRTCAFPTRG